ncbi:hypothetical protein [Roseomonas sp. WA12]
MTLAHIEPTPRVRAVSKIHQTEADPARVQPELDPGVLDAMNVMKRQRKRLEKASASVGNILIAAVETARENAKALTTEQTQELIEQARKAGVLGRRPELQTSTAALLGYAMHGLENYRGTLSKARRIAQYAVDQGATIPELVEREGGFWTIYDKAAAEDGTKKKRKDKPAQEHRITITIPPAWVEREKQGLSRIVLVRSTDGIYTALEEDIPSGMAGHVLNQVNTNGDAAPSAPPSSGELGPQAAGATGQARLKADAREFVASNDGEPADTLSPSPDEAQNTVAVLEPQANADLLSSLAPPTPATHQEFDATLFASQLFTVPYLQKSHPDDFGILRRHAIGKKRNVRQATGMVSNIHVWEAPEQVPDELTAVLRRHGARLVMASDLVDAG